MPAPIDHDLACLNCGYNLRGTAATGTCPECGMAVRATRREDRLAEAPPRWRARLRHGAAWFGAGALLTLPLLYLGLAMATAGGWRLTARQPGRAEPARDQRLRWAARLLLSLGAVILVALMAGGFVAVSSGWQRAMAMRWQIVDGAFIAGHALYWMGLLALGAYLEGLAERIPDASLLGRLRRFRWVWLAGMAAGVIIALAAEAADLAYRHLNIHFQWVTWAFIAAVAVVLLWLWLETLVMARSLHRSLSLAASD